MLLFIKRKDERKELISLSVTMALFGILADFLYVKDWWSPDTITGTSIGYIEAVLATVGIIGVGAVMPEYILKLKEIKIVRSKPNSSESFAYLLLSLLLMTGLFFGSFYLLGTNSLVSTVIALVIPIAFIWGRRKDLIIVSLINGFLLVGVSMIVYTVLEFLTPGWIEVFYHFTNTPNIIWLNVPIDDIVFYFLLGVFLGCFYEWWQGLKRIKIQSKRRL